MNSNSNNSFCSASQPAGEKVSEHERVCVSSGPDQGARRVVRVSQPVCGVRSNRHTTYHPPPIHPPSADHKYRHHSRVCVWVGDWGVEHNGCSACIYYSLRKHLLVRDNRNNDHSDLCSAISSVLGHCRLGWPVQLQPEFNLFRFFATQRPGSR
jgi:hypothetical protein